MQPQAEDPWSESPLSAIFHFSHRCDPVDVPVLFSDSVGALPAEQCPLAKAGRQAGKQ